MTSTSPAASVVMTTYNGGRYLKETIESILRQIFTDFELIIVDDCSSDNSVEIATSYHDLRIRHFQNAKNLGISHTRNRGLELARGEFIFACDQDDLSMSDRLEKQIEFMRANPGMAMVASSAKEWRNGIVRSFYTPETRSHILHWRLFTRCGIVHSSVCMRASVIKDFSLGYDQTYHYAEDYVLFHKLAEHGEISILPDELVIYREHDNNASSRHHEEMVANGAKFLRAQFNKILGMDIDNDLFMSFWLMFVHGKPVYDNKTLLLIGDLYFKSLDAFIRYANVSLAQQGELVAFARNDWWNAVCRNVNASGKLKLIFAYRDVVGGAVIVSWKDFAVCCIKAAYGSVKNAF
jgi:glycosyltransferase involved in cell wall biosynthesis